jgi:hypothetical protein
VEFLFSTPSLPGAAPAGVYSTHCRPPWSTARYDPPPPARVVRSFRFQFKLNFRVPYRCSVVIYVFHVHWR